MKPLHPWLWTLLALAACGGGSPAIESNAALPLSLAPSAPPPDPLGPRPTLATAAAFTPPGWREVEGLRAPRVWLAPRDTVPVVALRVVVPFGASSDPADRAGLAALTAEMMEQGAGKRDAFQIAQAFEALGAPASVEAGLDSLQVSVTVTRDNLDAVLDLVADVVARPRLDAQEWKRTQPLWLDQLAQRDFEPMDVAALVARATFFGDGHPYAQPVDGTLASVKRITLEDVRRFHLQAFRPEHAVVVLAGAVDDAGARKIGEAFAARWAVARAPALVVPAPRGEATARPRTVLVERPDAAQTAFLFIAPAPDARTVQWPAHALANVPLGGSFTSRLNANLREDKGYTYGIGSRLGEARLAGTLTVRTAVQREVTSAALKEILKEIEQMAAEGPRPEEVEKARGTLRLERIEAWQTVDGIGELAASAVALGVEPGWIVDRAAALEKATTDEIIAAARAGALRGATIVGVGDRATLEAAFKENGLPAPERRGPSGERL